MSVSVTVVTEEVYPAVDAVIVAVPFAVSASSAALIGTLTPVLQLATVSVAFEAPSVMSASPVLASATETDEVGAALSLTLSAELAPSATCSVAGVTMLWAAEPVTVNACSSVPVSPALSYARACTV